MKPECPPRPPQSFTMKILSDIDRGDPGALSDAIYSMDAVLHEKSNMLSSNREYNDEKFSHLNPRSDSMKNQLEKCTSKVWGT